MLEEKIKLAHMDPNIVSKEIGDFVIDTVKRVGASGVVMGLSGGIDSSTVAAIIQHAFVDHNEQHDNNLALIGYMLPSNINNPADTVDGIRVAEHLGIKYEVLDISPIVAAYTNTNPTALQSEYHRGNMTSRIRANILSTKSATEQKVLAGTGNWDEDVCLGYYTMFGDGAVHMSPIAGLPKRLVRQMAAYHGLPNDIVQRTPTAGLEPGQTDFGDLGYSYQTAEMVITGFKQGISPEKLAYHTQVLPLAKRDMQQYPKFSDTRDIVGDIMQRHYIANAKAEIIHPPSPNITLDYR